MIQVAYTNSNCSDVLIPFVNQMKKHSNLPLYLISDYKPEIDGIVDIHNYSNDEPYYKVWVDALKKFGADNFIYLQEDFFLYDDIKEDILIKYKEFLNESKYSFVRLLKSGKLNNKMVADNLFEIEPDNENVFSMQATIWKTDDYIRLMNTVKDPKWLENDKYRKHMIVLNMGGLYHFDNEIKIGSNHHDSNVYPYIATAVVRSKWNYREYKNKLEPILRENNINENIRGLF